MKAMVTTLIFLFASTAHAETSVLAGAWSKHLYADQQYNETHNLVAVQHNKVFAGYFVNSYEEDTLAIAYKWSFDYKLLEVGVYGGAMYGYRDCFGLQASQRSRKVCPMVVPFATLDLGPVDPQVYLLGSALAVGFKIDIGEF